MLKINPNPTFDAEVKVTVPGDEKPGSVKLTFKYMSRKDLAAFWEKNKKKSDVDLFMNFVEGWKGIDAEFNAENVELFLNNYPASGQEITRQYQRLLLESRVKN